MFRRAPLLRVPAFLLLGTVALLACGRADASAPKGAAGATASARATAADPLTDSALVARADRGRVQGPDSAMWVVMISDFQCPYCKQWHDSSMARLARDYITPGTIRFAYLHLPLSSIHQHARAEAEASMCASAQGKFWEYSESLFAAQPTVGTMSDVSPLLARIARELGLDQAAFDACRAGNAVKALVGNDVAQSTQAGVQSTPSFIIGDFLVQGALPYADFRKAIDSARAVRSRKRTP